MDNDEWLTRVALGATLDACGIPESFLGDYLSMLANAAISGQRPSHRELEQVRKLGRLAAESGISAARGVELYLSASRRVWDELPSDFRRRDPAVVRAATAALLQVVDHAVAAFTDGHAEGGREMIRREETTRQELIEDLLRGDSHLSTLVERAEPFGLDLTRAHQIALAQPAERLSSIESATGSMERVALDRFGARDILVATKEGIVVVLAPADMATAIATQEHADARPSLGSLLHVELSRLRRGHRGGLRSAERILAHTGSLGHMRRRERA